MQEEKDIFSSFDPTKTATVSLGARDLSVIITSMGHRCVVQRGILSLLQKAVNRELTKAERFCLPENMQTTSREDLAEMMDGWVSLVSHYDFALTELIKKKEQVESSYIKNRREKGEIL